MKHRNKLTIIILTLLHILCNRSYCCTCIGKNTVTFEEEVNRSDLVIYGKVISKKVIEIVDDNLLTHGFHVKQTEFLVVVNKIYKGALYRDTIKIISGVGHGDCGFIFQENHNYIIYAEWSEQYYPTGEKVPKFIYTDVCMRTMLKNRKEIRRLKRYFSRV